MTDKFLSTPSARRATTCCRCGAACGAYFYPRPPRGGRRSAAGLEGQAGRFLSTPSARRATAGIQFFAVSDTISIHALREEGDAFWLQRPCWVLLFLSTPSARRATSGFEQLLHHLHHFYPRPPRGGRRGRRSRRFPQRDFYPRPPRGGRLFLDLFIRSMIIYFYPRPPRGGRH